MITPDDGDDIFSPIDEEMEVILSDEPQKSCKYTTTT